MSPQDRVLIISHLLRQMEVLSPIGEGATSYELARYFNCTPQTVLNNLKKYGARYGIKSERVPHRTDSSGRVTATKLIWSLNHDDKKTVEFWRYLALKEYKRWMKIRTS